MMAATAAWGQPEHFEELGRKALDAAQAGRYQEAVGAYEQMLKIDPGNKGVRYDLALALNRLGRNRESLAALGKAADAEAFALAGLNHRALGDLASAEFELRKAFTLEPGPQIAADFGIVLLDRDKHQEAEKVFRRYPNEVRCLVGLGLAAYGAGKNDEAEKDFAAAAAREPAAADIRAALGDVYFATASYQDAGTAYREAIRLDGRNPEYRVKAGRNLLRLDQEAAALERFREAVRLEPLNAEAHFELGRIASAGRQNEAARLHLEASAAIDPGRGGAHYQLGLLYRRLGDPTRAAASMRRFEHLRNQDGPYRVDMTAPALVIEGPAKAAVGTLPIPDPPQNGRRAAHLIRSCAGRLPESYGMPRRALVSSDDGFGWREDSGAAGGVWSKPNGVMPRRLRLGNGMLVLSSGRPGVQLRISKSGLGDDWSEPVDVLPPTSDKLDADSCGHTGLVALDRDTCLIVYSWFRKPDADGLPHKVVLARRIRLTPRVPSNRGSTPPPAAASSRRALSTRLMKGHAYPAVVEAVHLRRMV